MQNVPWYSDASMWLDAGEDDEEESKEAILVTPSKKSRASAPESGTTDRRKVSLLPLIASFARPDAQEQKLVALELLTIGTKHARLKVPIDDACRCA